MNRTPKAGPPAPDPGWQRDPCTRTLLRLLGMVKRQLPPAMLRDPAEVHRVVEAAMRSVRASYRQ